MSFYTFWNVELSWAKHEVNYSKSDVVVTFGSFHFMFVCISLFVLFVYTSCVIWKHFFRFFCNNFGFIGGSTFIFLIILIIHNHNGMISNEMATKMTILHGQIAYNAFGMSPYAHIVSSWQCQVIEMTVISFVLLTLDPIHCIYILFILKLCIFFLFTLEFMIPVVYRTKSNQIKKNADHNCIPIIWIIYHTSNQL